MAIVAGSSYSVMLTITNKSTKGGTPVAATLGVGIEATAGSYTLISSQKSSQSFAAGQTRSFTYNMYVPSGSAGQYGNITGWIEDPAGSVVAQDSGSVYIEAPYVPPTVYYTCSYCGATFTSETELSIHTSEVHAEQLLYENWLRTGGTGSFDYWVSIGSPLYYTAPYTPPFPEPEPEPEPIPEPEPEVTYSYCPYCGARLTSDQWYYHMAVYHPYGY